MIEFIGFIIKLIFGGLLGGICNYNRIDSQNETSSMYSGAMIGIIGTISTSFGVSAGDEFSGFLLGIMEWLNKLLLVHLLVHLLVQLFVFIIFKKYIIKL